jgi:hypothetical protein
VKEVGGTVPIGEVRSSVDNLSVDEETWCCGVRVLESVRVVRKRKCPLVRMEIVKEGQEECQRWLKRGKGW